MDVLLIRHTAVAVAPGVCYGRSDPGAAPGFTADAAGVARRLSMQAPPPPQRIFTSPLQRCRRLAEFLAASSFLAEMSEISSGSPGESAAQAEAPIRSPGESAAQAESPARSPGESAAQAESPIRSPGACPPGCPGESAVGRPADSRAAPRAKNPPIPLIVDERLCELDFGRWEMTPWHDIAREQIDRWAADVVRRAPPGGEAYLDLYRRAVAFWQEHVEGVSGAFAAGRGRESNREADGCAPDDSGAGAIWIVTHAGVIRAILGYVLGIPLSRTFRIVVPPANVVHIRVSGGLPAIMALNG